MLLCWGLPCWLAVPLPRQHRNRRQLRPARRKLPRAPTEEPTAAEDPAAYDTTDEQIDVLDQLVDFGADTAGGSLKTAKAAAVLVEYLSCSDLDADVMADWCTGLTDDQKELLDLNWPGILSEAEAICGDPAGEADELITAGVTTDFENMALTEVPISS